MRKRSEDLAPCYFSNARCRWVILGEMSKDRWLPVQPNVREISSGCGCSGKDAEIERLRNELRVSNATVERQGKELERGASSGEPQVDAKPELICPKCQSSNVKAMWRAPGINNPVACMVCDHMASVGEFRADDIDARVLKQIEYWKAIGAIPAELPFSRGGLDSPEARDAVRAWLVAQDKEKADAETKEG